MTGSGNTSPSVRIEGVTIQGFLKPIPLRLYMPDVDYGNLPIIIYLHGGCFLQGDLDWADKAARTIASATPAVVVSVGYSLPPEFPFPAPLEDGYLACQWALDRAHSLRANPGQVGVAGHDAGGNLAAGICAMARDRKDIPIKAQALLAPLLDPSLTRLADARQLSAVDMSTTECAHGYRAYLPEFLQQLHPYAAPLESRRLAGLPPTLIVSAEQDVLRMEAEAYASALIGAGVPTQTIRFPDASHRSLAAHDEALSEVAAFFSRSLLQSGGSRKSPKTSSFRK